MNRVQIYSKKSNFQELFQRDGYVALEEVFSETSLKRLRMDIQLLIDKQDHPLNKDSSLDEKLINLEKTNKSALYNFAGSNMERNA